MPPFQTRVLPATPQALRQAADLLRAGQVVAVPTETVYGLAGHAFDPVALARIFEAKARPSFDPLIVHLPSFPWAGVWDAKSLDEAGRSVVARLAEAFWPGPLTLVLPRDPAVPDLVTSGLPTVGVRVPAHPVIRELLAMLALPLAAPSANRFGRISPTSAAHVEEELGGLIPLILDGGESAVGVESTILGVEPGGRLRLLRPGGIPLEDIEEALASVTGARVRPAPRPRPGGGGGAPRPAATPRNPGALQPLPTPPAPAAPGMLESHYAPSKPVVLLPAGLSSESDAGASTRQHHPGESTRPPGPLALLLQGPASPEEAAARGEALQARRVRVLSPAGDASEAARELFRALRELDADPETGWILAELAQGEAGLRHAINDRLRRAAAPRPPAS